MSDEPFGRQPLPVTVTIEGDKVDVYDWHLKLMRRAESAGDTAQCLGFDREGTRVQFKIYPRAVND